MASSPKTFYTPDEYLALERSCEAKHEYYNGEILAMGRVNARHVLIVTNLVGELQSQLKDGPCQVYSSALRVRVSPAGLHTYPDVVALCGQSQFSDEQNDTLLNPALIIEVLSELTQDYDRGRKFEQYRTIDSFCGIPASRARPAARCTVLSAAGHQVGALRNQQSGRYDPIEVSTMFTSVV